MIQNNLNKFYELCPSSTHLVIPMDGYAGNMVYADLSAGTVTIKPTPPKLKKEYIGGRGFGIRLLTDMVDPKIDPLGEEKCPRICSRAADRHRHPAREPVRGLDHLAAHGNRR